MKSDLTKICDGVQAKMDAYINEIEYAGMGFSISTLINSKAIKCTLVIADHSLGCIMFHQIFPVMYITLQTEQQAINYIFNSLMPTVNNIELVAGQCEEEEKNNAPSTHLSLVKK